MARPNWLRKPPRPLPTAIKRRFPPPWSIQDLGAAFVVKDSARRKLAYVYFEEKPGWRSAASQLGKDEARQIAANFAKLARLCGNKRHCNALRVHGYERRAVIALRLAQLEGDAVLVPMREIVITILAGALITIAAVSLLVHFVS